METSEKTWRSENFKTLLGLAGFCALSLLSRWITLALHLMVLSGIAFPLAWAWQTGKWSSMGFTKPGLGSAVAWGIGAGIASSIVGFMVVQERSLPSDLLLELAIGIPLWFIVASPFQELLFRGWLQPQLETWLGRGAGLLATTIVFTLWHYLWPLAAHSDFPLYTLRGLLATFAAGLAYGYSFQRTGNILAPWLGHALSGIAFTLIGAGSFGEISL